MKLFTLFCLLVCLCEFLAACLYLFGVEKFHQSVALFHQPFRDNAQAVPRLFSDDVLFCWLVFNVVIVQCMFVLSDVRNSGCVVAKLQIDYTVNKCVNFAVSHHDR